MLPHKSGQDATAVSCRKYATTMQPESCSAPRSTARLVTTTAVLGEKLAHLKEETPHHWHEQKISNHDEPPPLLLTAPQGIQAYPCREASSLNPLTASQPNKRLHLDGITSGQANAKQRASHSVKVHEVLYQWLQNHVAWPYPTVYEKQQLAKQTGLKYVQVSYWFTNSRRRLLPQLLKIENKKRERQGKPLVKPAKYTWAESFRNHQNNFQDSQMFLANQFEPCIGEHLTSSEQISTAFPSPSSPERQVSNHPMCPFSSNIDFHQPTNILTVASSSCSYKTQHRNHSVDESRTISIQERHIQSPPHDLELSPTSESSKIVGNEEACLTADRCTTMSCSGKIATNVQPVTLHSSPRQYAPSSFQPPPIPAFTVMVQVPPVKTTLAASAPDLVSQPPRPYPVYAGNTIYYPGQALHTYHPAQANFQQAVVYPTMPGAPPSAVHISTLRR